LPTTQLALGSTARIRDKYTRHLLQSHPNRMSYLALARKWRPRRFEDVLGQGPRGQGADARPSTATSCIRRSLLTGNAAASAKPTPCTPSSPRGSTARLASLQIPAASVPRCVEVDGRPLHRSPGDRPPPAAPRSTITRAMLDNVQYSPVRGRYKVYLIDEVHMLSGHSFNALLKTLEEPPPHVKFILATTDPQKIAG